MLSDPVFPHQPDSNVDFLPGRLDKRIREILAGLNVQWKYPEHPGRLTANIDRLRLEPVPGVRFEPGKAATRKQLARVHTTSFLEHIFALCNKSAWLDMDTTAVSPGSVEAAEVEISGVNLSPLLRLERLPGSLGGS